MKKQLQFSTWWKKMIVRWVKKQNYEKKKVIRKFFRNALFLYALPYPLNFIAKLHGTDKLYHGYISYYSKYFAPLRYKRIKLLEIGVGGFQDPMIGGESLRTWKDYFPFGKICGIDIIDKSSLKENRIEIFQGDQSDKQSLVKIVNKFGRPDIIIDDGSHRSEHVITSFNALFPLLKNRGIYVIEDLHTSYWRHFNNNIGDLNSPCTSAGMIKNLIDGLNYQAIPKREPCYTDQNIIEIHCFPKIVFILKDKNQHPLPDYWQNEITHSIKIENES